MNLIPSGINYVGNKYRMLPVVMDNLDTSRDILIDVFCGSGVVGVNAAKYFNEVCLNDGCWQLIEILKAIQDDNNFISNVEKIINAYNLGKNNKEQFINCRNDFNEKYCKPESFNPYMCYALACHSFSYNMVFNKNGGFSVPSGAGRSWFNPTLKGRLMAFQHVLQTSNVGLLDGTFQNLITMIVEASDAGRMYSLKSTMFYLDPPYSACCADGSVSRSYGLRWSWKDDEVLFAILDELDDLGAHWLLSNVFENKGVENRRLIEWSSKYNVIEVPGINYSNAHYQAKPNKAKEVLIRNY